MSKRISKAKKEQIANRAGYCCEYCRSNAANLRRVLVEIGTHPPE